MKKNIVVAITLLVTSVIYSQSPCKGTPTVNYEGKAYQTVQIGKQCWLKENLDVGTMIPFKENSKNDGVIEKYCYDDDLNNCKTYGALYQWSEVVQYKNGTNNVTAGNPKVSGKVQGICPSGWHLPTIKELLVFGEFLKWNGQALKEIGQEPGFSVGTNTSGFSAIIYRDKYVKKDDAAYCFFWLGEESFRAELANAFYIVGKEFTRERSEYKYQKFHVRCLKD